MFSECSFNFLNSVIKTTDTLQSFWLLSGHTLKKRMRIKWLERQPAYHLLCILDWCRVWSNVEITLDHNHYMVPEFTFLWAEALPQGSSAGLDWPDLVQSCQLPDIRIWVQVKGSSCLPAFVCEDVSRVCVECCVLEKVGAGRPCICYSPCFVHSANAELFKGIHMLKAD